MVLVDYYSRYPEVSVLTDTRAEAMISTLKEIFARWGNPRTLRMDNGPQFACTEMKHFLESENIKPEYSPPYWPRANGLVERMNRNIKLAIQKSLNEGKPWKQGLMEYLHMYRSVPQATTGRAPADLLLHRRMRGKLPTLEDVFDKDEDFELIDRDARIKEKGKIYGDGVVHAKPSDIATGDKVLVKRHSTQWFAKTFNPVVCEVTGKQGPKVTVKTPSGKQYERASCHLKKLNDGKAYPEKESEVQCQEGNGNRTEPEENGQLNDPAIQPSPKRTRLDTSWAPQATSTPGTTPDPEAVGRSDEGPKRPTRDRIRPKRLLDYELYKIEEDNKV